MKTRVCAICKVEKPATDEHFGRDGGHSYCRPCEKTYGWIERRFGKAAREEWKQLLGRQERRRGPPPSASFLVSHQDQAVGRQA